MPRGGYVIGKVELAGKIIEHDHGYRAEWARVVALLPVPGQELQAEAIAKEYGAQVSDELLELLPSLIGRRVEAPPDPAVVSRRTEAKMRRRVVWRSAARGLPAMALTIAVLSAFGVMPAFQLIVLAAMALSWAG